MLALEYQKTFPENFMAIITMIKNSLGFLINIQGYGGTGSLNLKHVLLNSGSKMNALLGVTKITMILKNQLCTLTNTILR